MDRAIKELFYKIETSIDCIKVVQTYKKDDYVIDLFKEQIKELSEKLQHELDIALEKSI